jgi:hypothetical protein
MNNVSETTWFMKSGDQKYFGKIRGGVTSPREPVFRLRVAQRHFIFFFFFLPSSSSASTSSAWK